MRTFQKKLYNKDSLKVRFEKNRFLFKQLVQRDFTHKYKGTALGMLWSVLSPLMMLFVMKIIFTQFFGRDAPHYTTYLLSGNIVMAYYREATKNGMSSLVSNARIIGKINVPKYLFIFSKNVSSLINFGLTIVIFFIFCFFDHITFGWHFLFLIFPVLCLVTMNVGIGMILSAWYVRFKDTSYLYDVFLRMLQYFSAIFYQVDRFPEKVQKLFLINPVYCYIKYFREITISGNIPSVSYHLLCAFYALFFFGTGSLIYKVRNKDFIYYL